MVEDEHCMMNFLQVATLRDFWAEIDRCDVQLHHSRSAMRKS